MEERGKKSKNLCRYTMPYNLIVKALAEKDIKQALE